MGEDRVKILKMLQDGQISADEAEKLLAALNSEEKTPVKTSSSRKFLRILIESSDGDNVNVNIPLSLAEVAMNFIPEDVHMELEENDINLEMIIRAIEEDAEGEIVNINSSDGDIVRIVID